MKITQFELHPYCLPLIHGNRRSGLLIQIKDREGRVGWGDVAPLPHLSQESFQDVWLELHEKKKKILEMDWILSNCLNELDTLRLYPSVCFGLESALLSIIDPLPAFSVTTSALLMGTFPQIIEQAEMRKKEGFKFAKLKVSQLSFEEAFAVIQLLKESFSLRIDVNRAWSKADSLSFFSQFSEDSFDYVEEPFQNPQDLCDFTAHPLAIDESFPTYLSLNDLDKLKNLKALIYKPTIQGGWKQCLPLQSWTVQKGISFILSSAFESDLGLAQIANLAYRLKLRAPIGLGTYHFLGEKICKTPFSFCEGSLQGPMDLKPNILF